MIRANNPINLFLIHFNFVCILGQLLTKKTLPPFGMMINNLIKLTMKLFHQMTVISHILIRELFNGLRQFLLIQ